MKTIYFLRHGQTDMNRRAVHQHAHTELGERGCAQARAAGEHFKDIPLDLIVVSPLVRTRQTAEAVRAFKPDVPVEYHDLFAELRRPSEIHGVSWFTPSTLYVLGLLYLHAGNAGWHYSDEENLAEFHARTRAALEYLASRPEERILVVTHRGFMATAASLMRHDGLDSRAQYLTALWHTFTIKNCSYLTATWSEEGENGRTLHGTWQVERKPLYIGI
jgi:broad specificity phosphatase PhoE